MKNCAIYIRVSSQDQVKGYSLEAQEKAGINICKQNDWSYTIFKEAGRSADKETLDNRPEMLKVLDLAEDGQIDFCFATEIDRLSRQPVTQEYIKTVFRENDVKVVTVSGVYDYRDEEQEFMADLLGLLAKRENKVRVKRSKRAVEEGMRKGFWCLGSTTIPYGYRKREDKRLEVDPEQARIYHLIVDWAFEGMSMKKIARRLESMGVPTKHSTAGRRFRWHESSVSIILKHYVYKGKYVFKGHEIPLPKLIDEGKWDKLQKKLQGNFRPGRTIPKYFYLLKGLLYCKRCKKRFVGWIKPECGQRSYACGGNKNAMYREHKCNMRSINLDNVNKLVWETTKEISLNSGKIREAITSVNEDAFVDAVEYDVQIAQLEKQLRSKKREISEVVRKQARFSNLSDEDANTILGEIKQEREEIIASLKAIEGQKEKAMLLKERADDVSRYLSSGLSKIDEFTDKEKAEFLRLVIDKIWVEYDPSAREHHVEIVYSIPIDSQDDSTDSSKSERSAKEPEGSFHPCYTVNRGCQWRRGAVDQRR